MPNPRGALLQVVFLSMIIHGCQHSIHGRLFFLLFYLQVVVAGSIFCIVVDVNVGTLCAVFHLTN